MYSSTILQQDFESVRKEFEIMTQVQHENLIDLVGICVTKKGICLVTKLIENGDLFEVLHGRSLGGKRLDEGEKMVIAIGLAKGLKYLSKMDVVHRDLKPANVLIEDCEDGDGGGGLKAMIMDFGFSRFVDCSEYMTGETGSYRYMAPEMIRSEKYDEKVDMYSFGVMVNEMFTGKRPFQGILPVHAAVGVATKGLRPSQKGVKNKRLSELVSRCWSQKVSDRLEWGFVVEELESISKEMKATIKTKRKIGKKIKRSMLTRAALISREN